MLTDIFARRYEARKIWDDFRDTDGRLLVQCFRILSEQLMPPRNEDGKKNDYFVPLWATLESRLSMELGVENLSPKTWGFYNKANIWMSGEYDPDAIVKSWMMMEYKDNWDADQFMKRRLSFVELAFRNRQEALAAALQSCDSEIATILDMFGGDKQAAATIGNKYINAIQSRKRQEQSKNVIDGHIHELNERFTQARVPLEYNNGYLQFKQDEVVEVQTIAPFWKLASDAKWANVSTDMAEAVDRRDTGGRDPAFYAAKALESVIKIISDQKGWTTGAEKGAANYIDNLVKERDGVRMIDVWEKDTLIAYFGKVRNPLGHGPGGEPMPNLTAEQTNWAIENAMSWSKSLIERV